MSIRVIPVMCLAVLLSGCVTFGGVYVGSDGSGISIGVGKEYDTYNYDKPTHVPEAYMPPPGQCRIWYPDREPEQQPPPGDCEDLEYSLPYNAELIEG